MNLAFLEMATRKTKIRLGLLAVAIIILLVMLFFLFCGKKDVRVDSAGSFEWAIYNLNAPYGVAIGAEENVYVSNTGAGEVNIYDRDGELLRKLLPYIDETIDASAVEYGAAGQQYGASGQQYDNAAGEQYGAAGEQYGAAGQQYGRQEPQFYAPYGIAIDIDSNKVYVCDFNWRGVRVVESSGKLLYNLPRDPKAFKGIGADFIPYGVALMGDRVYVAAKDGVYIFDNEGKYIERWGQKGDKRVQFNFPNGIATDPDHEVIYVTDSLNRRLVALEPSGKVKWTLGAPDVEGQIISPLQLPRSVTVGPYGLVLVSDTFSHRIDVFDKDGKLVSVFGERGTNDYELNFPEGMALTADRRLYIVDRGNNRLQAWRLASELPKPDGSEVKKFSETLKTGGQ